MIALTIAVVALAAALLVGVLTLRGGAFGAVARRNASARLCRCLRARRRVPARETDVCADRAGIGHGLDVLECLPTGTVTLLLADVEGSTRLWESRRSEMTAAVAQLDHIVTRVAAVHNGVRPVEQGEGDSFVLAFDLASDAVACALELQRTPLGPIRLRIGVHTGEVQLRDEGNYIGPTVHRAARLRDLAHGGQTVLSGVARDLVGDQLPDDVWLTDLGTHRLRDLPRPERVTQLCHPDLCVDFPPLRVDDAIVQQCLSAQPARTANGGTQTNDGPNVAGGRLVTLSGADDTGTTRLALQAAVQLTVEFRDGVWYVGLAPDTDPDIPQLAVGAAGATADFSRRH